MIFSLLWDNEKEVSILDATLFNDLKITKLLESCFDNYSDVDEMIDIMKLVPNKKSIIYRQGIFEDILSDHNNLYENLYYQLVDLVSRYNNLKEKSENVKKRVFLIMYLYHYYLFLENTKSLLVNQNVKSYALNLLIDKINILLSNKEVIAKREKINKYYNYIINNSSFSAEYHDGAPFIKLSFDKAINLEDELLEIAEGLNVSLIKTPRQIMKKEINPYFLYHISLNDKKAYEEIALFYDSFYNDITDLSNLVLEFKYLLNLKTVFLKMAKLNIPFCKVLINDTNETEIKNAYDISLTVSKIDIVPNDYYANDKENIAFVLGVNSGGKTCYLRSVASNYVFFSTSGYMFAESAKVYPVKHIFTHFPNEENYGFGEGRLYDELKRMDKIKKCFSEDTICFLNEKFSSTSEEKACVYTKQLLDDIGNSKAKVMYVTHQYKIFEEISDPRIGFFTPVVLEKAENVRTHKIKKVEKQLLSYVDDILYKHGLTKQQLLERKNKNG